MSSNMLSGHQMSSNWLHRAARTTLYTTNVSKVLLLRLIGAVVECSSVHLLAYLSYFSSATELTLEYYRVMLLHISTSLYFKSLFCFTLHYFTATELIAGGG